MENETPYYELDEDTRTLLCTVIELAFLTSNLQIDTKDSEVVANICFQTASRFGIEIALKEVFPEGATESNTKLDISNLPFKIEITDKDK